MSEQKKKELEKSMNMSKYLKTKKGKAELKAADDWFFNVEEYKLRNLAEKLGIKHREVGGVTDKKVILLYRASK